ncbi:BatA domain-containing protein, partial [Alistipes onderdonkii]|uniref:BatA domain-containing protein n=1 Tax=Alistipes onderdonkii TaxID=328813 RepID=UPI00210BDE23
MHFASPYYLWLLTALVPMAGYYVWRTLQGGAAIQISSVDGVVRAPKTIRYYQQRECRRTQHERQVPQVIT